MDSAALAEILRQDMAPNLTCQWCGGTVPEGRSGKCANCGGATPESRRSGVKPLPAPLPGHALQEGEDPRPEAEKWDADSEDDGVAEAFVGAVTLSLIAALIWLMSSVVVNLL